MPGNRQFSLVFAAAVISSAVTFAVDACPYCPRMDATLSEKLAESDAACVVMFLDSKNGEELSMQTTRFQVARLMRNHVDLKVGSQITVPFGVTGQAGDRFLMLGQKKDDVMEWNLPIPMDELEREYAYLRGAPSIEKPPAERLPYFLKFLDSKVSTISNDAFGEFAKARFEDVEELAPNLSRETVRKWVEDPRPEVDVRRAFYGMLLGLCGNDNDAAYLEQKILAPIDPTKNRLGIEGMMGGYLLLKGPTGLKTVIQKKVDPIPADLSDDDPRIVDLNALRMTLSFLWDYRRKQFSDESLRTAMRRFLDWHQLADMAVVDLARWKDWAPLDRLIDAYGKGDWADRSAKRKIVAYALSCRKDVPKSPEDELPVHAVKAQRFLDSLDPDFVQSVKAMSGGAPAVLKTSATTKSQNADSE